MATQFGIVLASAIFITAASTAIASEHRARDGGSAHMTPSTVLVRAHKLTGLDANNREQVLFLSEHGTLLSLTDLASIGTRLNAKRPHIPDGAYHSLKLELANDAIIYGSPSGPVHTQLRSDGGPEVMSMLGTVLVTNSEVNPLALALDTGRPAEGQDAYPVAKRDRAHATRDRNHDREYEDN